MEFYGKYIPPNLPANRLCGKIQKCSIEQRMEKPALGVIGTFINEAGCKTIIVNGVEDNIHCLVG